MKVSLWTNHIRLPGVFGPILLQKLVPKKLNLAFIVLKQFGTGIIVSTAFVHVSLSASRVDPADSH